MSDSKFDPYEQQALIELLRIGEQEKRGGRLLTAEIVFAEIEKKDNAAANGEERNLYDSAEAKAH